MEEISSRDVAVELGVNEREAAALQEALAYREAAEVNASLEAAAGESAPREIDLRATALAQKVSQAAFDLIVQHETGGRNHCLVAAEGSDAASSTPAAPILEPHAVCFQQTPPLFAPVMATRLQICSSTKLIRPAPYAITAPGSGFTRDTVFSNTTYNTLKRTRRSSGRSNGATSRHA